MRPRKPLPHAVLGTIDKVAALLGSTEPLHWLTMAERSSRGLRSEPVSLYEVDGRTYILDVYPRRGRPADQRAPARATLTTGRSDASVTLTEVTDPAVKRQVVIASAAEKPTPPITRGKGKGRPPESILVTLGIAPDDSREGLAAAVPHVAVFEVRPA